MLMNNLDPEVAERPQDLVVYGGAGRAARNWASFEAIVGSLHELENDETLIIQSGKPVGVFQTHEWAATHSHRQREPRWPVGRLASFWRVGARRPDHVWPDDCGELDLYRHARHPARYPTRPSLPPVASISTQI